MKLTSDDVCFNWTPLYHDMGLVNNYFLCLARGVPLVMLRPTDFVKRPGLWLRGLSTSGATVTWSPNFGYALAATRTSPSELTGVDLSHVRAFWNAAERIHLDTVERFYDRFAPYGVAREALKTNFGCAENVGGATFSAVDGPAVHERISRNVLYRHHVARPVGDGDPDGLGVMGVGRASPGLRVHIRNRAGRHLSDGEVGEIVLETPSHMEAYLADAKTTRRVLLGEFLKTGDVGYLRNGELFWLGRNRERIVVRGKKFDPSDLERVLLEIPGLRPGCFAAFGVDDETLGTQRLVVVSEVQHPLVRSKAELGEEVRDKLARELGVPVGDAVLVEPGTLTKTSSGKRRHRYFRDLYLQGGLTPSRSDPAARVS